MAEAVGAEGHKTLEKQQRLQWRETRRIALEHRQEITPAALHHVIVLREHFRKQRLHHVARHVLACQPPCQPCRQCFGKVIAGEHHVLHQVPQARLVAAESFRLGAELRPQVFQIRGFPTAQLRSTFVQRSLRFLLSLAHENFPKIRIRLPGSCAAREGL